MAVKASHRQGSGQDTHVPGSPSHPRAPAQTPAMSRSQGPAPQLVSPPCLSSAAVPVSPVPACAATFLPRPRKGSDLATAHTSRVPNRSYKRQKSSAVKNTAHLFIEEHGICYIPAETVPKSQVGLFLYISK